MNGLYDELRVALHSIWIRRWIVLGVAWAIALLGWLLLASISNTYKSEARLLVEVNNIIPTEGGSGTMSEKQQLDQIRQTLTSARNLEKVAVTTGLLPAGASDRDKTDAIDLLRRSISVVAQEDNIFELSAEMSVGSLSDAENAKLATGVVDSLITVFRDEQLRGGRMNAREGLAFLDTQITEREAALKELEAKRAAFEAQHIGILPTAGGSPGQRIDMARSELSQVEAQLAAAQGALGAINAQLSATPASIATPGMGPAGVSAARQQLANAQGELAGMRARGLTEAHPDVITLRSQIAALQAQAAREPAGGGAGSMQNPAYAQLAAQRAERAATVSALSSQRARLQSDIARITAQRIQEPGIAAEYERINGDYTVAKDQYDKLLAQRESIRLRGKVETETNAIRVDILNEPTKPRVPVAPNRPLLLTGILLAAIAGGLGAAFALGQVHSSYPTAQRLERASGLPVIGSITEVLTATRAAERARRMRWLVGGAAALGLLYVVLLVVEYFQRGLVA